MSRISDIVEKSTVTSGRRKISQRQAIDQWLLDMTLGLMHTDPEKTGEMIRSILNDIGLYTGCDRVYVYAFGHNARLLTLKHAYYKEDMPEKITTLSRLEREEFKWMIETIRQFRTIKIQTPADIPPQAKAPAYLMQKERSLSMLLQPIGHGTEVFGILGVDMVNKARVFSDDTIYILDRMARILGGTIMQAGSTERR